MQYVVSSYLPEHACLRFFSVHVHAIAMLQIDHALTAHVMYTDLIHARAY